MRGEDTTVRPRRHGPLDGGGCLWVLTALAAKTAAAWAVWFARGHALPGASRSATRATAALSPTQSPTRSVFEGSP